SLSAVSFFQAEDGIRDVHVTGVQTCALPILWLSDFTYVSTWSGFVYVAFVIDAYACRIVGWRVSRTAHASFVLDALDQALHERQSGRASCRERVYNSVASDALEEGTRNVRDR